MPKTTRTYVPRRIFLSIALIFSLSASTAFGNTGSEEIYNAIKANNLGNLIAALEKGANPNGDADYPFYHYTPLRHACEENRITLIAELLKWHADPNVTHPNDPEQTTPLFSCADMSSDGLQLLLSAGADPLRAQKVSGRNALHIAIGNFQLESVKKLLAAGTPLNHRDAKGTTPLAAALYQYSSGSDWNKDLTTLIAIVKELLKAGADVNAYGASDVPLLTIASSRYEFMSAGIPLMILRAGAREWDVREPWNEKLRPVQRAVEGNATGFLDALLQLGVVLKFDDPTVQRLIQRAQLREEYGGHVIEVLVRHGIIPLTQELKLTEQGTEYRFTLLYWAAYRGNLEFVKYLVAAGADLSRGDLSTEWLKTPLEAAVRNGKTDVIRYLLAADPSKQFKQNYARAVRGAVVAEDNKEGNETLRALLEGGVDPNLDPNEVGQRTSCHLKEVLWRGTREAQGIDSLERLNLLLRHGADPNLPCTGHSASVLAMAIRAGQSYFDAVMQQGANAKLAPDALLEAAQEGPYFVRRLVEAGADVNYEDSRGTTALITAAYYKQVESVKYLVSVGAKLDPADPTKRSALHVAAEQGQEEIALFLLHSGAAHNPDPNNAVCAFYWALKNKLSILASEIFSRGVTLTDLERVPYLRLAARLGDEKIVRGLLQMKASPKGGPLHEACFAGYASIAELLIQAGANIDQNIDFTGNDGMNGETPISLAASKNRVDVLQLLIRHGVDLETFPNPLQKAVEANAYAATEVLLKAGANVNYVHWMAKSGAIHNAAGAGFVDIARLLIQYGAKFDAPDVSQCTPLHYAAYACHDDVVSLLVQAGANKDALCNNQEPGWSGSRIEKITPLAFTSRCKDPGTTLFLLSQGANPNLLDSAGTSALAYYVAYFPSGTPIETAISNVEAFLKNGADINLKAGSARTPLEIARARKDKNIQKLIDALVRWGAK